MLTWIKTHKLTTFLLLVVGYLLFNTSYRTLSFTSSNLLGRGTADTMQVMKSPGALGMPAGENMPYLPPQEETTPTTGTDRMVVENSTVSLLVKNVTETINSIKQYVESAGGYMVNQSVDNPAEAATGTLTVRVPHESLDETIAMIRKTGVKVVSENLTGTDVTDQYQDIEERLTILEKNKARFEEIMSKAVEISDIISIQNQIFSIQNQIDSYKGQQQYLSQTAKLSRVTIYLSTDELSLPYAPQQPWHPQVIFKYAVRNLIGNFRKLGTLFIWVVVYAVVWMPIGGVFWLLKRRKHTFQPPQK